MRSSRPGRPREVEGVLHVAGGVLRRHVERLEAVVVVLHLGPVVHQVAHAEEDVLDLLAHDRERMAAALRGQAARQGHVDALAGEAQRARGALERRRLRLEARLQLALQRVQLLAGGLLLAPATACRSELMQLGEGARLAPEEAVADRLQRGGRRRRLEVAVELPRGAAATCAPSPGLARAAGSWTRRACARRWRAPPWPTGPARRRPAGRARRSRPATCGRGRRPPASGPAMNWL